MKDVDGFAGCISKIKSMDIQINVVHNEWKEVIYRNICQGIRNKVQSVGMTLVMSDFIEPMMRV